MLKQRIITALLLIPLVLWLVLFADTEVFSLAMMVVIGLAAWEWAMLSGLNGLRRAAFAVFSLLLMLAVWLFIELRDYSVLLVIVSLIWLLLTISLILQKKAVIQKQGVSVFSLIQGIFLLLVAWFAVTEIHAINQYGPQLVLLLMVMIWIADSAAYFSGRLFGKHKLSPQVSPGKTWEGVAGGLLAVAVYGYMLPYHAYFEQVNAWALSLVCVLIAFISIGGDLFESKIKRQRGVKDSGRLLPGHGGVYDRIDSLIAAAPVYLLAIYMLVERAVL